MALVVDPAVVLSTTIAQRALPAPDRHPARVVRASAHGTAGVKTTFVARAARGSRTTRTSPLLLLFATTARHVIYHLVIVIIIRLMSPLLHLIALEIALVYGCVAIDVVIVILTLYEPLPLVILVARVSLVIARKLVVIASHICAVFSALTC